MLPFSCLLDFRRNLKTSCLCWLCCLCNLALSALVIFMALSGWYAEGRTQEKLTKFLLRMILSQTSTPSTNGSLYKFQDQFRLIFPMHVTMVTLRCNSFHSSEGVATTICKNYWALCIKVYSNSQRNKRTKHRVPFIPLPTEYCSCAFQWCCIILA